MQLPSVALDVNAILSTDESFIKKKKKVQQYVDSMAVMAERNSNSLCGLGILFYVTIPPHPVSVAK